MKKSRRPREGVWCALALDHLFTVRHPIINFWGPSAFFIADNLAAVPGMEERVVDPGPNFYEGAVFIGEF